MRSSLIRLSRHIVQDVNLIKAIPPARCHSIPSLHQWHLLVTGGHSRYIRNAPHDNVKEGKVVRISFESRRMISSTAKCRKEEWPKVSITDASPNHPSSVEPEIARPDTIFAQSSPDRQQTQPLANDTLDGSAPNETKVKPVPDEHLPSHRESQRWRLSQWFTRMMDEMVPKLVLASQRINSFTGTDYTAIEELRREIKEQEQLVRDRHLAVKTAKETLDGSQHERASSHKELVGLLERKHSWSAADLERYMSLIRSEHQNDLAVQAAKDAVMTAEKALEEGRARLEKRERTQYHEEQIWSDTIRRNSTWVTFGLMGFNILLLLTNVVILEPWRRRRMVREVKAALDEKSLVATPIVTERSTLISSRTGEGIKAMDFEVDQAIPPTDFTLEELSLAVPSNNPPAQVEVEQQLPSAMITTFTEPEQTRTRDEPISTPVYSFDQMSTLAAMQAVWQDLLSTRTITLRKVDFTTIVLESAAIGALVVGTIVALLR